MLHIIIVMDGNKHKSRNLKWHYRVLIQKQEYYRHVQLCRLLLEFSYHFNLFRRCHLLRCACPKKKTIELESHFNISKEFNKGEKICGKGTCKQQAAIIHAETESDDLVWTIWNIITTSMHRIISISEPQWMTTSIHYNHTPGRIHFPLTFQQEEC